MKLGILLVALAMFSSELRAFSATPTPTPSPTPATVSPHFTVAITDNQTVDGYKLKWGTSPGNYTTTLDLGNTKTHEFTDFPIGTVYMVATCYNAAGESPPTPEVQVIILAIPHAPGGIDVTNDQGMAQISTRSQVAPGDNVMIGGFIVRSDEKVAVRAIGPSLGQRGVPDPLTKTSVELHDSTGDIIKSNDGWLNGDDVQELKDLNLAPESDKESALIADLKAGPYTAIVRGAPAETGIGLVEVYALQ